jgi:hypothetical protein
MGDEIDIWVHPGWRSLAHLERKPNLAIDL